MLNGANLSKPPRRHRCSPGPQPKRIAIVTTVIVTCLMVSIWVTGSWLDTRWKAVDIPECG